MKEVAKRYFKCPGEKIRRLRESLGISQSQFAQQVQMSPSALCRLEKGHNIHSRKIVDIAEILGIHPRELNFSPSSDSFQSNKKEVENNLTMFKKLFPSQWKDISLAALKTSI